MNLKDLPEGLPAVITKFKEQPHHIGDIVKRIDKTIEIIDKGDQWGDISVFTDEQAELDYNTPFSIKYLPEGYIAEIVDDITANKGKKVKIIKSANPPFYDILVEAISTQDDYTAHHY